ncbi:hypothetical protein GQ53DRAFT_610530, partial [Thozetella sp. PMI_491]
SQWKWNWFAQKHSLAGFSHFDEATRSAWGSVKLLGRLRLRHFACVGALISILSIVASPITQQMIQYSTRLEPQSNATATISATQHYRSWIHSISQIYTASAWQNMINVAIQSNTDNSSRWLSPLCPTSECRYPRFSTLGVCSKTANITSHLEVTAKANVSSS